MYLNYLFNQLPIAVMHRLNIDDHPVSPTTIIKPVTVGLLGFTDNKENDYVLLNIITLLSPAD